MGITTKDLAQLCGVSRTTVHRALYGGGRIHPDTKEMILRVAKEHDYRPDLLARGLVKGRIYYIGVVVMDVRNRYFAGMLSAIGREAAQHGYNINITLHDNNRKFEQDQLTRLSSYRMDGIILSSVNEGAEYAKFLESLETPIVTVDNKIADGLPFVSIDQRAAMREAVEHILEMKKYERIVFVCPAMAVAGEQNIYVHRERKKGFEEAMAGAPDNVDTLKYITPQLVTVSNKVDAVAKVAVQMLFALINAGQEQADEKSQVAEQEAQRRVQILPHELIDGETL